MWKASIIFILVYAARSILYIGRLLKDGMQISGIVIEQRLYEKY